MNLTDDKKQEISQLVRNDIASICKLYGVDFWSLTKKELDMYVSIFQAGVGFIETMLKTKALQSSTTNNNKLDDQIPY